MSEARSSSARDAERAGVLLIQDKDGQVRAVPISPPSVASDRGWDSLLMLEGRSRWGKVVSLYLLPMLVGLGMIWLFLESHSKRLLHRDGGEIRRGASGA